MSDDTSSDLAETPIDAAVGERIADETGVELDELTTALVELNARLIGRHSAMERHGDYVTDDGIRAYRVPAEEWESILEEFEFGEEVERAVRRTHTEQAHLMFTARTDASEGFADDEFGVVVGVDTAEQF